MKKFKTVYTKNKSFRFKGKIVVVEPDREFSETDELYQKFKLHFVEVKPDGARDEEPEILLEHPIADEPVKVVVEDEVSSEVVAEPINTDVVEPVDYTTLETKEELIQFIEDNELSVKVGNIKNLDRIKKKIERALEA